VDKSDIQETLVALYLRLNGYFVSGFIVHATYGASTELDVLAVRFPRHEEPEREVEPCDRLAIPQDRIDFLVGEVKGGSNNVNFNARFRTDPNSIRTVLRRFGAFGNAEIDRICGAVPQLLEPHNVRSGACKQESEQRSNEASQFSHPCRRSRLSSARSHLRCCRISGQSSGDQGIVSAARISTRTLSQGYAGRLVQACRERGLQGIAITDHHDMAFVPYVRQAAAEETDSEGKPLPNNQRLVVFPGMELTLGVPCQALLSVRCRVTPMPAPGDRVEAAASWRPARQSCASPGLRAKGLGGSGSALDLAHPAIHPFLLLGRDVVLVDEHELRGVGHHESLDRRGHLHRAVHRDGEQVRGERLLDLR